MMVDNTDEPLSALVDDECSQSEMRSVLASLSLEPEKRAKWQRYHLISDVLKNNLPTAVDRQFADAIRKAIDAETVVSLPPVARPRNAAPYRPLVGLALAASLAMLAVFGLKLDSGNAIGPGLSHVPQTAQGAPTNKTVRGGPANPRLAAYLVNHNEYASVNSVHGVLTYVSMANYQASR
ncbi:MAG: sigma-E factor negative regulatory protein [Gammaproteobacteria bacterium]